MRDRSLYLTACGSLLLHGVLAFFFLPSFSKTPQEAVHTVDVIWERKPLSLEIFLAIRPSSLQRHQTSPSFEKQKNHQSRPSHMPSSPQKPLGALLSQHAPHTSSLPKASFRSNYHPLPSYPWVCRKRKQEGVVAICVQTNPRGKVISVSLHKSSGHSRLDEAALEALKKWTFAEGSLHKTFSISFRLKG